MSLGVCPITLLVNLASKKVSPLVHLPKVPTHVSVALHVPGRTPLIVGGSTLYLQALIHGLSPVPPADASIRMVLESRLSSEGSHALFQELKTIDPQSASALDPTKTQRLIRSLEVYYQTGNTLSSYLKRRTPPPYRYDVKVLTMDRARLYERIDKRVDRMLEAWPP